MPAVLFGPPHATHQNDSSPRRRLRALPLQPAARRWTWERNYFTGSEMAGGSGTMLASRRAPSTLPGRGTCARQLPVVASHEPEPAPLQAGRGGAPPPSAARRDTACLSSGGRQFRCQGTHSARQLYLSSTRSSRRSSPASSCLRWHPCTSRARPSGAARDRSWCKVRTQARCHSVAMTTSAVRRRSRSRHECRRDRRTFFGRRLRRGGGSM
jgi:hypothetical protein